MSLRELNASTRRRLRVHGWMLTLWCVFIGVVTSWFLLHVLHLRAPAARYAISAIAMYSVGLLLGVRYWLSRFAKSAHEEVGTLGTADEHDRIAFDEAKKSKEKANHSEGYQKEREKIGNRLGWGFDLLNVADLFSLGEFTGILIIPGLLLVALGVLLLLGLSPLFMVDGLAALLAEMAVQFIFGALIARRALRIRSNDDPFLHIVGKTWWAGLLFVLVSAAAGALLTWAEPNVATVGEVLRPRLSP
jgi:hypothetical protein